MHFDSARQWRPVLVLAMVLVAAAGPARQSASRQPDSLSSTEFSRLVRDLSEDGGFFRSDNFTSNETSYLHVVGKLRQLAPTGGAYIGVGPEQNFTYIAKIRPRIAFIVDIRRQAMIQHLIFKAVFHLSSTRAEFLSRLISRPLPKEGISADASVIQVLAALDKASSDDQLYTTNVAAIRGIIQDDLKIQLSEADQRSLDYVYRSFRTEGLDIAYRVEGGFSTQFPSLREIIVQPVQHGKLGNFLAGREDYEFVRDLHKRNMIIPVVGDFAGTKALAAVGDYLKKNGFTVTAFYTSNVEQYLYQGGVFEHFAENVRKLPTNDKSLFIRAVPNMRFSHPASFPGHRLTTLLQYIKIFLQDYGEGRYPSYRDLTMTNYIAGESPQ
jgi:hypothetical protein